MEKAIQNILANDSNLQGVLNDAGWGGGGTKYKIYHLVADGTVDVPYVTYQRINTDPHDTKDGVSGLDVCMLDVDIWADNNSDLFTIAGYVRTALDRKAEGTYNGETLQSIRFMDHRTDVEERVGVYHLTLVFSVREKR